MKKSNKIKIVKPDRGISNDLITVQNVKTKVNAKTDRKDNTGTIEASIVQSQNKNIFSEQYAQRDCCLPAVGSIIARTYKGRQINVKVLKEGLEYQGKIYKSISGLAVSILGYPISGYVFFKLGDKYVR